MALRYVDEVASYYRRIVSDPDATAIDAADIAIHLAQGEAEFRRIIGQLSPTSIRTRVAIAVNGNSYDLADDANTKLMGRPRPVAVPPVAQWDGALIHRIHMLSLGTSTTTYRIQPARDWEHFQVQAETGSLDGSVQWMLDGTVLRFTISLSTTIQMDYFPVSSVNWAQQTAGQNEWISEFVEYHDLIALLAAAQYLIEVSRDDPRLATQLVARERDFKRYLTDGRIGDRRNRVTPVP